MELRIKEMRINSGITQRQVAELLQCDQSLYSKYERGQREIPLSYLIKLADYYSTTLDYLTYRTNKRI